MILASHAILGAAASRLVPDNLYLGFLLGAASHFVADAISHWDYSLRSATFDEKNRLVDMRWGRDFLIDLFKIALDIIAGVIISFLIFKVHGARDFISLFAGIVGGILPDGLQFLYSKIKKEPFVAIEEFHIAIHSKKTIRDPYRGILSQSAIVAAAVLVSVLLTSP